MIISPTIKLCDDRPRILWRYSLTEPDTTGECKMKNTPLELFICPQTKQCQFECIQKDEQRVREEFVHDQTLKMQNKIETLSIWNGNDKKTTR